MLGNTHCEQVCDTEKCRYDGLDCVTQSTPYPVYVSPDASEPFLGTLASPYQSLSDALTQSPGDYVLIYLLSGSHALTYASGQVSTPLSTSTALEITLTSLLCDTMQVSGCCSTPAIIQLTPDLVTLNVTRNLTLRNVVIQGGFPLKPGCDGAETCTYCPVLTGSGGGYQNDRGEWVDISHYAEQTLCDQYSQLPLFYMSFEANFTLQNVSFLNIRHQPLSLITNFCGNLVLENVTFSNIMTSKYGSGALTWQFTSSKQPYYCGSFDYHYGVVELLNNGYELNIDSYGIGFGTLIGVNWVRIEEVVFRYNNAYVGTHKTDYSSSLLYMENPRQVQVFNCTFFANLADQGAAIYILTQLTLPIINNNGVSQEHDLVHFHIRGCQFLRNFARLGATLYLYFADEHQNVLIENSTFIENIVRKSDIVSVSTGYISDEMEVGKVILTSSGNVMIPPSYVYLEGLEVRGNIGQIIMKLSHVGVGKVENCVFYGNGEPASDSEHVIWPLQEYRDSPRTYMQLQPPTLAGLFCQTFFLFQHVLSVTATSSTFSHNFCSLGSPGLMIEEGLNTVFPI